MGRFQRLPSLNICEPFDKGTNKQYLAQMGKGGMQPLLLERTLKSISLDLFQI